MAGRVTPDSHALVTRSSPPSPILRHTGLIAITLSFLPQHEISIAAPVAKHFAAAIYDARKAMRQITQEQFLRYLPHFFSSKMHQASPPESAIYLFRRMELLEKLRTAKLFRNQFPNIKALDLSCGDVKSRSRRVIVSYIDYFFPRLHTLKVVDCSNARDGEFLALQGLHVQLRTIDFSKCGKLTWLTMQALQNQRALTSLNLSGCPQMGDRALSLLGGRRLRNLHVSGCAEVTEKGLVYVAAYCPSLRVLDLSGCYKFKIDGLLEILRSCISLRRLNLRCCTQIDDDALAQIGKFSCRLTKINLAGCGELTDQGVETLGKSSPNLTDINLKECQAVTSEGAKQLLKMSPKLRSLRLSPPKYATL